MAAALELTAPAQNDRYEVTVYQLGWRLGGKGASGRGPSSRIEEHGLHVWMGWYENAFRLLRDCYAELGRDWQSAFTPAPLVAVTDRTPDGGWAPWMRCFPPAPGLPGDPAGPARWTVADYLGRTARLVGVLLEGLARGTASDPRDGAAAAPAPASLDPATVVALLARAGELGQLATLAGMTQAAALLEIVLGSLGSYPSNVVLRVIDAVSASARRALDERLAHDLETRRIWSVVDLALATMRGSVAAGLLNDPRGFDALDDYDCREWLLLNGASPASVDCGYLRGLYDLGFAYEDGDPSRPRTSAAQAVRGFFRAFFTYRGAFFWKMNGGMGDVVFAPIYEVLRRRGVRFEFFHRLRDVRVTDDAALAAGDAPHVTALDFDVQASVRAGAPFEPLVDVRGMPSWPAEPDWSQLVDGERLRADGVRFECHWDRRRVGGRTLEVGRDFDFVVLGVGLGAVPHVAASLVARDPRWRAMVEHVGTVATQAFQLWLREDTEALGWSGPPVTLSGFVQPFDTWADMRHLLPLEDWTDAPAAIAYFCSALPDLADLDPNDAAYPERQREAVRANAVRFMRRDLRHLWPRAVDGKGEFRWDLLVGAPGGAAAERFASQFWTANVNPSDRYTLSLPGSSAYRISPLDPTYDNLTVCGDWTDCGFNSGCVEAAVMSGRLAAHALSKLPALADIVGFDHP
jgi:uncharacterized protein with NAD-binding domain and iron-sulfur cluster